MSAFGAADLEQFRVRLTELAESLETLERASKIAAETVTLDQSKVGRLSRMDALQGQAMAVATAGRRRQELVEIRKALERLTLGNFGECTECQEPIDPRRVSHNPAVALCLACASAAENC